MPVQTFSVRLDRSRASCKREAGQTQAEYGVVLAVITASLLAVFTAFSGAAEGAANRVIGLLPG